MFFVQLKVNLKSGYLLSRSGTGLRLGLHYDLFTLLLIFFLVGADHLRSLSWYLYWLCNSLCISVASSPTEQRVRASVVVILINVDLSRWSVTGLQLVRPISVALNSTLPHMICNFRVLSDFGAASRWWLALCYFKWPLEWVGMPVESVIQWAATRHALSPHYITISVVEWELCFSLGLKPHSVPRGEILSPHLWTGDNVL